MDAKPAWFAPNNATYAVGMFFELQQWSARRWGLAATATIVIALVVGLPTDVIPNPVFGRPVAVTWWSYPVLAITAILGGLLAATYTRDPAPTAPGLAASDALIVDERSARTSGLGGLLSFFAVGCPVCNKLVIVALGAVGARRWFEPIQPLLAVISVVLMVVALRARLRNAASCPLPAS